MEMEKAPGRFRIILCLELGGRSETRERIKA